MKDFEESIHAAGGGMLLPLSRDEFERGQPGYYCENKQVLAVSLRDFGLTGLPESLGQLSSLRLLDLSGNRLSALPEALANLAYLQKLDLDENELTTLPDWIGGVAALETLNCTANRLASIPQEIGRRR